jgi:molecular chaperone GrpE
MEDSGNVNNAGAADPSAKAAGENETAPQAEEQEQERGNRMDAAKAFYRAMYAGGDPNPDEYGLATKPAAPAETVSERTGPCPNCAFMEQQLNESQQKALEYENLYKRMAADFENYRKRQDREKDESAGIGTQKAIEAILPAMDDLDRAKQTLTSNTDVKAILDSLNLVYTRFNRCLEGLNIKPMEVIGQPFDPRLHEPVQEIQTNQFADGHVMHELRKGYMYKDKVLRPTLVNVASNPSGVVEAQPDQPKPEGPSEAETASQGAALPIDEAEAAAQAMAANIQASHPDEKTGDEEQAGSMLAAMEKAVDTPVANQEGAESGTTLDALNDALANLVGVDDEKGADLGLDGSSPDAHPDAHNDQSPKKGKKQKVYDITDSES